LFSVACAIKLTTPSFSVCALNSSIVSYRIVGLSYHCGYNVSHDSSSTIFSMTRQAIQWSIVRRVGIRTPSHRESYAQRLRSSQAAWLLNITGPCDLGFKT